MAGSVYSGLSLDGKKIGAALQEIGANDVKVTSGADGEHTTRYEGKYNGKNFLIRVYLVKGGKYTLGYAPGYDRDVFNELADAICAKCRKEGGLQYSVSAPKRPRVDYEDLCDFLTSQGAKVIEERAESQYDFRRIEGTERDRLVVKFYRSTGTLQVQGRHASLATYVNDFFCNVLSLDELIAKYAATYSLNLTTADVREQLEAKLPSAAQSLGTTVLKQLSSALALTKIELPLEDFGAVAFPALRALEGLIYQTLVSHGVTKEQSASNVGDYFEPDAPKHVLKQIVKSALNPRVASFLEDAYTMWNNVRHPLFHMDANPDLTVTLTRQRANQIVQDVLTLVETNHEYIVAP